jgi:HEAT repeat protein
MERRSMVRDVLFILVLVLAPSGLWVRGQVQQPGSPPLSFPQHETRGDKGQDVSSLIAALSTDPNASVREHAATALGRSCDGRAVAALAKAVQFDPSARVREHAASALARVCGDDPRRSSVIR